MIGRSMLRQLFFAYLVKTWSTPSGMTFTQWWDGDSHLVRVNSRWGAVSSHTTCPLLFSGESSVNMRPVAIAVSIKGEIRVLRPTNNDVINLDTSDEIQCGVTAATSLGPLLAIGDGIGVVTIINLDTGRITCITDTSDAPPAFIKIHREPDEYSIHVVYGDGSLRRFRLPWATAHCRCPTRNVSQLAQTDMVRLPPFIKDDIIDIKRYPMDRLLVRSESSVCAMTDYRLVSIKMGIRGLCDADIDGDTLVIRTRTRDHQIPLPLGEERP